MAKTTINIPGVAALPVPFLMTLQEAKEFMTADYPQIGGMDGVLTTDANGDANVTFSQRTGTKG